MQEGHSYGLDVQFNLSYKFFFLQERAIQELLAFSP
jgi:hypothetical protein